jgi:Tfp pilus assembly protein PilF
MQQVSAFSRPQTVPAVPTTAPPKSQLWILNSWRDLILYVATPLLLVPLFLLAQARWSAEDIYLFVAAFGAMGHHLPGMIRAYGDRALFERFRWRFIVAPIFLVAVCVAFYWWDLRGIILVVFFWGVWHGMMQTYGFCRIYDAKRGSFAALTRRLDFATAFLWFAAAVALSDSRMGQTLEVYYECGGPYLPPWLVRGLQQGLFAAAVGVSVLSLANFVWMWTRGKRPNPVKLVLLATTISFWWYCNNWVVNILVGIALFEVFHDVQYLSLVWIYNRNRVEKDSTIGGFMRFVFRRSGSLIGLYVGLVFAYGSLGYFNSHLGIETVKRALTGVVTASALLHFYYDGFIWKVREKATAQSLGLEGGSTAAPSARLLPGWALHGLKWVAAFVIPLGALWSWQARGPAPELDRRAWLAADLPSSARQHFGYGAVLDNAGRTNEAADQYQIALRQDPSLAEAHNGLAGVLRSESKFDAAIEQYQEAVRLAPTNGEFHFRYAETLQRIGHDDEAVAEFESAIRFSPKLATPHLAFGDFLNKRGRTGDAKAHYAEALRLNPKLTSARLQLGDILMNEGEVSQAIIQFKEALRVDPNNSFAAEALRQAKESDGRFAPSHP